VELSVIWVKVRLETDEYMARAEVTAAC